jgi:hypothetical protein
MTAARHLVAPPIQSMLDLQERIVAACAGRVSTATPFHAGDVVIVPHALWRAAGPTLLAGAERIAAAYGVVIRAGYVDQAVVERARPAAGGRRA